MVCNCLEPRRAHGTPCCALNERTDSGVTGLSNVGDMLVVNFVSLLAAPIYRDVQCLQLLNQTSGQTEKQHKKSNTHSIAISLQKQQAS
ncbi:Transcriptional activator protein IrlR [Trichinella pseudospiralis]